MKLIEYKICVRVNYGTDEEPQFEEKIYSAKIECKTQESFDANYPIAEREAIEGTIEVTGEFDPEPEVQPSAEEILNALLGVSRYE